MTTADLIEEMAEAIERVIVSGPFRPNRGDFRAAAAAALAIVQGEAPGSPTSRKKALN